MEKISTRKNLNFVITFQEMTLTQEMVTCGSKVSFSGQQPPFTQVLVVNWKGVKHLSNVLAAFAGAIGGCTYLHHIVIRKTTILLLQPILRR